MLTFSKQEDLKKGRNDFMKKVIEEKKSDCQDLLEQWKAITFIETQ